MSRRKISTTVYLTPAQDMLLKELHSKNKVAVAEYIRQGIDLILEKHNLYASSVDQAGFDKKQLNLPLSKV